MRLDMADYDLRAAPGHLIRRAQQQHQNRWSELVGASITSVQFAVLALLAQRPGLDQRTLAQSLAIDTSTLADVCLRLSDRGLLERERSAADGRRYRLRVTPSGERLVQDMIPKVDAVGERAAGPPGAGRARDADGAPAPPHRRMICPRGRA